MDETQQPAAAASLSDQLAAADEQAVPAAAAAATAAVAHPQMPLWMELDEDASSEAQLLEMRDAGGQERWGSEPLSSIRSPGCYRRRRPLSRAAQALAGRS